MVIAGDLWREHLSHIKVRTQYSYPRRCQQSFQHWGSVRKFHPPRCLQPTLRGFAATLRFSDKKTDPPSPWDKKSKKQFLLIKPKFEVVLENGSLEANRMDSEGFSGTQKASGPNRRWISKTFRFLELRMIGGGREGRKVRAWKVADGALRIFIKRWCS